MKKLYSSLLPALLILIAGLALYLTQTLSSAGQPVKIPSGASEDNGKLRKEWMRRRLADPATGKIPEGIAFRERWYAASLPRAAYDRSGPEWQSRGPWNVGGRTRALAIDVTNENRILAGGVSGGIWLSEDGGQSWSRRTPLNAHPGVVSVAQDTRPGHTDTWYYLSGEVYGTSASANGAFYLGDGMFKSTDGGLTWAPLGSTAIGNPPGLSTLFQTGWRVMTDPTATDQDIVYMATIGAIYRSTNGGTNWTAVRGGNINDWSYFTDMAITSTGVLYATLSDDGPQKGIWRSTNGVQWTDITPDSFPPAYDRVVIGINPDNENEVYFLGATPGYGHYNNYIDSDDWSSFFRYTYLSGNGSGAGGQWTELTQNLPNTGTEFDRFASQGGYDLVVKVQPGTGHVFIGGTNIWRSFDGFTTPDNTTHIGGYKPGTELPYFELYPSHHPDQHDFLFLPSNPNVMLTASDGGVHRTENALAAEVIWSSLNRGYQTSQFYTVAVEKSIAGDPTILGGLQDNGNFITTTSAPEDLWNQTINGDGAFSAIIDNKPFYITSIQQGRVAKITLDAEGEVTGFQRFDPADRKKGDYQFINPLVVDPVGQNELYLPAGRHLYRHNDLQSIPVTDNWDSTMTGWTKFIDTLVPSANGGLFTAIAVSQSNPAHRLYAGTDDNRLIRIDNADSGAPSWTVLPKPNPSAAGSYTSIAIDPENADHVVIAYSNYNMYSIYRTLNGGQNWIRVAGNLETSYIGTGNGPSIRWIAIMPYPDGTRKYFAGTSVGLYSADTLVTHTPTQPGTQWVLEGADVIGSAVVDYIDVRPVDGLVVAATHGNGMFSANFSPATPSNEPWSATAAVRVGPNPATSFVEFTLPGHASGLVDLELYDLSGRLVRQTRWQGERARIGLEGLADGMYVYALSGEGWKKSGKVIKN